MPFIKFTVLKHYTLFTTSISFNGEIINPDSYYTKKGLVYIIITAPFSRQPSSYLKCIKANTCSLYDMCNGTSLVTVRMFWWNTQQINSAELCQFDRLMANYSKL